MSGQQYQIRGDTRANMALATPAARELFVVTDKGELGLGDGATAGGILLQKKNYRERVTAAQITADQNNYAPAGYDAHCGLLEISSDAARAITGLGGGTANRVLFVANKGAFNITLSDASGSSTAANRFSFGEDVIVRAGGGLELYYSATDSRWERATGGLKLASIPEELALPGDISPTQIAANTNDYNPTSLATASRLRLSTDASRNLTGIAGGADGRLLILINVGSNSLVLKDADAGSTAANRFDFGVDITLGAKNVAVIQYDSTDSRWKMLANTAGAAVANGAVTAVKLANSAIGVGAIVNGYLDWSVSGNALTVALKTLAGTDPSASDPVLVEMRSATVTDGKPAFLTVSAALSVVVSSGSSLGATSATAFRVWAVMFNDAGTARIGVINCLSGTSIYPLAGWGIASSTAEGGAGAADSAQVFYTGTAVAAKAFSTLGYATWETGLTTAGTWAAGPTRIQAYGPGVPLPGQEIQPVETISGASATGSTQIPFDDTIPQNTEGDQFLSQAITPTSAANLLDIDSQLNVGTSGDCIIAGALFQDSTANALAVSWTKIGAVPGQINLHFSMLAGTTSATTFKMRAGPGSASTTTFNGQSGSRQMGGKLASFLRVREKMV